MTGPEHYNEAERLLAIDHSYEIQGGPPGRFGAAGPSEKEIAAAQVHATLALAAATLDAAYGEMSVAADEAWSEVITHA